MLIVFPLLFCCCCRYYLFTISSEQIPVSRSVWQRAVRERGTGRGQPFSDQHQWGWQRPLGAEERVTWLLSGRYTRQTGLHRQDASGQWILDCPLGCQATGELAFDWTQAICASLRVAGWDSCGCQHTVGRGYALHLGVPCRGGRSLCAAHVQ